MKKSEHLDLIKEQALALALAEVDRRKTIYRERKDRGEPALSITPWNYSPSAEDIPPRRRDGERVWAELSSTLLDRPSWLSIAEYLDDNVKGLSGTSWLEGRFEGLELKCGTLVGK